MRSLPTLLALLDYRVLYRSRDMLAVSIVASVVPMRRAVRTEPSTALRVE